jgi:ribonuclease D
MISQGAAEYVASLEDAERLFQELGQVSLLGVDTEAASFHRYHDRVFLLQISTRERTTVIDPLAVKELPGLGAVLANRRTEIVFHDADYDLRILDRDYGFRVTRLFDTRVAAQLLNEPGIGLAALLEKYLGVRLDKRHQRADWSMRPLTPDMLEYAASDTRHLPVLRDLLRERLEKLGRWSWAEEEFRLLEAVRWTPPGPPEEAYLRLKGARALRGEALAILRALYAWREETARRLDRATFRVMSNEILLAIAEAGPADAAALRAVKGISADVAARRGSELLAAVRTGIEASPEALPIFERSRRSPRDPEFDAAVDRLKATRNNAATRLDLATGVLCPNGTLEAIARVRPQSLAELAELPEVRQWQVEVLGKELLAAVKGNG